MKEQQKPNKAKVSKELKKVLESKKPSRLTYSKKEVEKLVKNTMKLEAC